MPVKSKADLLREQFGFDLSEGVTFRATALDLGTLPTGGLATTEDEALTRINASPYVKKALKADDVYVHTIEAGSNRFIADRYAFLDETTIANVAAEASIGFAFMIKHATGGGFFGGESQLPYGRTFAGQTDARDGYQRVLVQFYMLTDHRPNGSAAPSTDDLDKGMVGGTLFDVSLGFKRGGMLRCNVCEKPIFNSDCPHFPGSHTAMSEDDIARSRARGVPDGAASFSFVNCRPAEVSLVFSGAIPNAGTAFAEERGAAPPEPTAAPPDLQSTAPTREEEPMYNKELKIRLGLAETATDAEVDAKLASLSAAATENEQLRADRKRDADAAFAAKWKEKLGDDLFAQLQPLPNREELATTFAAKIPAKPANVPPIGSLTGTALAAAPNTDPAAQPNELEEEIREGMGVFASAGDLDKAVMTSPLAALSKCLGVKLTPTAEHKKREARILDDRRHKFGIKATQTA